MKFSIVVPVYNSLPFLDSCITSVQKQKITDWELILVDDGSTDGSDKVLTSYVLQDHRIRYYPKEHQGQFYARQRGIEVSNGEYILFLDSDDELEENCLSALDVELQKKRWDIILYTGQIFLDGTATQRTIGEIMSGKKEITVQWLRESLISSSILNSLCLKAFRRELFEGDETDYTRFIGTHYGEDKARLLYPVSNAKSIFYIPDQLYRYNLREESTMHCIQISTISRMLENEMFSMLYLYMKRWNMDDQKHREKVAIYYLRNYLSVYYGFRRKIRTPEERKNFRNYPWGNYLDNRAFRFCYWSKLTIKEKIKILIAELRI